MDLKNLSDRLPRLLLAGVAFAVTILYSAPSATSMRDAAVEEPTAAEMEAILELTDWLLGPSPGTFNAVSEADIAAAIRSQPRGFELFRSFNGEEPKRRLLRDLPYGRLIYRWAERHDLDALLVAAVVEAESSFDAAVVSPAGAIGLMQVMPQTAAFLGTVDPTTPEANLEVGTRYLRSLLELFEGDLELALAAYNAGPANVARHDGVPPFPETRRYVERVLSTYVEHHKTMWQRSETGGWLLLRSGSGSEAG